MDKTAAAVAGTVRTAAVTLTGGEGLAGGDRNQGKYKQHTDQNAIASTDPFIIQHSDVSPLSTSSSRQLCPSQLGLHSPHLSQKRCHVKRFGHHPSPTRRIGLHFDLYRNYCIFSAY